MKKFLTKFTLSLLVLVMMAGIIKLSFNITVKASEDETVVEEGNIESTNLGGDSLNGLPELDDDEEGGPNGVPLLGINPGEGASTNGLPELDDDEEGGPNGVPLLGVDPEEENA